MGWIPAPGGPGNIELGLAKGGVCSRIWGHGALLDTTIGSKEVSKSCADTVLVLPHCILAYYCWSHHHLSWDSLAYGCLSYRHCPLCCLCCLPCCHHQPCHICHLPSCHSLCPCLACKEVCCLDPAQGLGWVQHPGLIEMSCMKLIPRQCTLQIYPGKSRQHTS